MPRRLLPVALAIALAFAVAALTVPHSPTALRAALPGGAAAVAVALGAWVALTPAMFPGTVLALASGLAFGVAGGSLVAIAGGTAGGCAAFALARWGSRGRAADALRHARARRLVERLERRGILGVALLRVAPGVPATALHYACGLTRVRARDFAAGIALGGAPRAIPYVLVGAGLGAAGGPSPVLLAIGAGGIAVAALAGLAVAARARRAAAGTRAL